jgi:hypothetical protein
MEGAWLVSKCLGCSAFELWPEDGGDALGPLAAALRAAGSRPIEEVGAA